MNNEISLEILLLYASAIFWTLGYDTIYGAQDMSDDEIIGIKSTSIKFKKNIKFFVTISYTLTVLLILLLFFSSIGLNFFSGILLIFFISLAYQLIKFEEKDPASCLKIFKFNNFSGLFLFISILLINY